MVSGVLLPGTRHKFMRTYRLPTRARYQRTIRPCIQREPQGSPGMIDDTGIGVADVTRSARFYPSGIRIKGRVHPAGGSTCDLPGGETLLRRIRISFMQDALRQSEHSQWARL